MKKILLCLCTLTIYTVTLAQQDARLKNIDAIAEEVLKDWHGAGFAVAVVERDKIIYAKGFGYRDVEKKLPVTPNTQFAIGSCTKSFTAALIGSLNQEGLVDIDKPVREYLPALKFYNNEMNEQITLRDMMCHRTGLSRYDLSWFMFNSASKDSLLQRIQYHEPSAPLRTRWQYNNWMFLAQGVVAEKVTGKSWEDNIEERFFRKLDMNNSNLTIDGLKKNPEPAIGYFVENDSAIKKIDYFNINAMAPAGSINSSVNDMANWVITWIMGGKFKGKEVLNANYIKEAVSAQMSMGGGAPAPMDMSDIHSNAYGFGWMLTSYRGHYQVEHGGNINGFTASACFYPTDNIGIIILSNQNASIMPTIMRNKISDKLLGLKDINWNKYYLDKTKKPKMPKDTAAKEAEVVKGADISRPAEDFTGYYENKGYGKFEIVAKGDSLFAQIPDGSTWYLKHYCYDIYDPAPIDKEKGVSKDTYPWRFTFRTDENGKIAQVSVPMESPVKPTVFTRTEKGLALKADDLKKYEGDYVLMGVISKIYRKGGEQLFLTVPGQPEYTLIPSGKDKFSIKGLAGFNLQFTLDDKQEVTELTFLQPNGKFKATKKK
ncbi:serine hydrolase [Chitinophaga sp. SYP-B3965]|uniref:serine hydrolase n=1 Tax=Chitinophaga sp. SYP-B3965 TaxID=2663120 RepID=UPI001299AE73|nr:serine hydrolase [Chitinophaga sp. SYP-B3965]MRG43499.1 serine hydrolase [Chitinophaga sp. SYP-B3965]